MYERDFKGVWVPREVWLNGELGWTEKMLLVEIESLDNENGCFASNEHFATFFGLSKNRISKMVSTLKEKGYITVKMVYKEGSKQIDKRIIRVDKSMFYGIGENDKGYWRKRQGGIGENAYRGIGENDKDNNTSINNTINNTSNIKTSTSEQVPPASDSEESKQAQGGKKRTQRIYETNEPPYELAVYLYSRIAEWNAHVKQPNFHKWADAIRLMNEKDGVSYEAVKRCIDWVQTDDFWIANILSAQTLRKQYAKLYAKAAKTKGAKRNGKYTTGNANGSNEVFNGASEKPRDYIGEKLRDNQQQAISEIDLDF